MAALTQDRVTRKRGAAIRETLVIGTSNTTYVGAIGLRKNTTARLFTGSAATGRRIAGIVVRKDSTTNGNGAGTGVGNTSGTEKVIIEYGNEVSLNVKTAIRTNTSLGLNVFCSDDQTVGGTAVGTSAARIVVGQLRAWDASDKSTGWVAIGVFGPTNIAV